MGAVPPFCIITAYFSVYHLSNLDTFKEFRADDKTIQNHVKQEFSFNENWGFSIILTSKLENPDMVQAVKR